MKSQVLLAARQPRVAQALSKQNCAPKDALRTLLADMTVGLTNPAARAAGIRGWLNGDAYRALRDGVDKAHRQELGAYFTHPDLATRLVRPWTMSKVTGVLDPACGAGDLLLAVAGRLPLGSDAFDTVRRWSKLLHGWDLEPTFVELARLRLALLALKRGGWSKLDIAPANLFPGIRVCNALEEPLPAVSHVVTNPPYTRTKTKVEWANGQVNTAAVFVDKVLRKKGVCLAAILPDVLRSGTRYEAWRTTVAARAKQGAVESIGEFDESTGIDVFTLHVVQGAGAAIAWRPSLRSKKPALGTIARVSVGPLVDYRSPKKGSWLPYLEASWLSGKEPRRRRFDGPRVVGPFVAIHRTSSPNDRIRFRHRLWEGAAECAVENHLIVVRPHDGKLETCRAIAKMLDDPRSAAWVNKRLRCRHLTTGIIRALPILD